MKFMPYPFERLRILLKASKSKKQGLNLSIGEPGFNAPNSVIQALKDNAELIRFYPTLQPDLIKTQRDFIQERFGVQLKESEIVPTFGSREALFNFPHFIFLQKEYIKKDSPVMAFPNPFYQIYEGTQIITNAQVIYMPLNENNNFKPSLSKDDLERVDIVILNSPNNPTGQALTLEELEKWVKLALKYNFILINDECYSDIYSNNPPPSLLEASVSVGNTNFKNIFVINSISKRICVPGLRSGFVAGNSEILERYKIFRTYIGISIPTTLQKASIIAWKEYKHAQFIREKFRKNLSLAQEIFKDSQIFPYTFYLWLKVQDCNEIHLNPNHLFNDEVFCKELYEETGHIVLPGSYLGRNDGGIGYVRIALTQEEHIMIGALKEIKKFCDNFIYTHACSNR
ncbi:succinyldiaminopimelate transaminase [Helicobacter didelphidarum]|uniref:Succinyldiaminopimelate transaminase n=1 Tax=Helicobacter didelphidarum TaxID=2040648 RepID=A0A3D8IPJ4_9HELI|nr:succinyldiaminopimelate transaminase [Helicobacter didelphidarum]RDU66544.1 succinyldiaminopimelate transaminase [Helicobacter didelphidarum]